LEGKQKILFASYKDGLTTVQVLKSYQKFCLLFIKKICHWIWTLSQQGWDYCLVISPFFHTPFPSALWRGFDGCQGDG